MYLSTDINIMLHSAFIFFLWPCFTQKEVTFIGNCKTVVLIFFFLCGMLFIWQDQETLECKYLTKVLTVSLETLFMLFDLVFQART